VAVIFFSRRFFFSRVFSFSLYTEFHGFLPLPFSRAKHFNFLIPLFPPKFQLQILRCLRCPKIIPSVPVSFPPRPFTGKQLSQGNPTHIFPFFSPPPALRFCFAAFGIIVIGDTERKSLYFLFSLPGDGAAGRSQLNHGSAAAEWESKHFPSSPGHFPPPLSVHPCPF